MTDFRPAYLTGHGRGRGRGAPPSKEGSGSVTAGKARQTSNGNHLPEAVKPAAERFQEASNKFQESAQRCLQNADFESDSGDESDDIGDEILESIFKSYKGGLVDGGSVEKAQDDLLHSFRSSTSACLVCIESIKREDAIWSCQGCACLFHIPCIQRWVREGVYQQTYQAGDDVNEKVVPWHCPKCRFEYAQSQCPTRYLCFCGKVEEPKFDPWLVPHSCGQICSHRLKPDCGHECLLLCHPGPCPPCPQTVKAKCFCGQSSEQIRRCSARTWSCSQPCHRILGCGHHRCEQPCHVGDCSPCPRTSEQRCLCRRDKTVRPCADPEWQCDKPCRKTFSCGKHLCEEICHAGSCGECPRSGVRLCPCGKTKFDLPCTEDIPTCGDTCGKSLDCQIHTCSQRCHTGQCGTCRQMAVKTCRCQQRQKEVLCYKEYLCDLKCSNMRDCEKHQCKRKCCDGNCPTCEQPCGKMLSCRNHKCASRCHRGPCYPCPLTVEISCSCRAASITVPCGRGKATKPPRCNQACRTPPDCHHPQRTKHRCHFGDCPQCRQICRQKLPNCDHACPAVCHTAVRVKVQDKAPKAGPWEGRAQVKIETIKKSCPKCIVPVPVSCLGNHQVNEFPCSQSGSYACSRLCGRQLTCGNHECSLQCHSVTKAPKKSQAGVECEVCEQPCSRSRPAGCSHSCLLSCHVGDCPPCQQRIRMRCHCKATLQHIECDTWTRVTQTQQNELQACGGVCPKNLPCGHQCKAACHPGICPEPEKCDKKVTLRCPCRRRKRDFICKDVQSGASKLECDDKCKEEKDRKRKVTEETEITRKDETDKREQDVAEDYEKRGKGRKRRPRHRQEAVETVTFWQRYGKWIIGAGMVAILIGFVAYLLKI